MNAQEVTIARIYIMEGHDQLNEVFDILRDKHIVSWPAIAYID